MLRNQSRFDLNGVQLGVGDDAASGIISRRCCTSCCPEDAGESCCPVTKGTRVMDATRRRQGHRAQRQNSSYTLSKSTPHPAYQKPHLPCPTWNHHHNLPHMMGWVKTPHPSMLSTCHAGVKMWTKSNCYHSSLIGLIQFPPCCASTFVQRRG